MALKAVILPVPDAVSPIDVLLLVQLYTVPAQYPVMVPTVVVAPLPTSCFDFSFDDWVDFTVI